MIIIIPIGGIGKRFKDNGYSKPKALINIYGKPIISYLLDNLNLEDIDYIYIPYNREYKQFRFEDYLIKNFPNIKFKFHCLDCNTRGAAETINIAINHLDEKRNLPVLCFDSDNFYKCDIISKWKGENCVFTFEDYNENPIYSYVSVDNENKILDIKEKEKISNNACTGAYGFRSINELERYTSKIIKENKTQKSEFYTSGIISEMISDGFDFFNKIIENDKYICLGTPIQLKLFYNNYPRKDAINHKYNIKTSRICFDLDNTLVTYPEINNDYSTVKPIQNNINYLKYLKSFGNTIIIYTARRMKTHNGNIGKINADVGKITFETLEKFDIPYDEIYFGKPYADFYIDDLAVNCFDDMEKELGFYNNKINPRDFHKIELDSINTITKTGEMSGENYYYTFIPNSLKDLFPVYIDGNDTYITIEKIKGVTVTELYLSELLTKETLVHILNSIRRIHSQTNDYQNNDYQNNDHYDNFNENIYLNYSQKLRERYNSYNYSSYTNSEIIYQNILKQLEIYEKNQLGIKSIIHGDPVFTNILINKHSKIKFIDMRGRLGDNLTIYGDRLYDWAKIYQSLIGYDEILMSKIVNSDYKNNLIEVFKNYFIKQFSLDDLQNLKMITKSLLFSLVPLHNNEKCQQYFNLINSEYLI